VHLAVTLFKQFLVEHNSNSLPVKVPLVDEGFVVYFLTVAVDVAVSDTFTNARALTIVTTIYVKVLYKVLLVVLYVIL
jgi:hypothetical protein